MSLNVNAQNSTIRNRDGLLLHSNSIQAETINIGATATTDEAHLIDKLPYAERAAFNHYSREGDALCLPNTRTQVLANIMAWVYGGDDVPVSAHSTGCGGGSSGSSGGSIPRIYWLSGMAGTGKSTIARTIARRCCDEGRLGASFFFSLGGGELDSARRFVTSIAVQLARRSPALRAGVCSAIRANPDIVSQTLSDQWKQLVMGPCAMLPPLAPLVIVVDALDECADERGVAFVLQLAAGKTLSLASSGLLLFLTSRPEIPIREGLENIPASERRHLVLHRISPAIVDEDIRIYIEHNLGNMLRKRPLSEASAGGVIDELVRSAGGLFIWAATACRFVKDGRPKEKRRLEMLLQRAVPATRSHPQHKLDEIYHDVLANAISPELSEEEAEDVCLSLRIVLGAIAVLFSSLSALSLDSLLGLEEGEVQELMSDLHSIFDVPDDQQQVIRSQHASVGDFLLDRRRCADKRFWVDEQWAHTHVACQCLKDLEDNLKRDMCDLREPGTLAQDVSASMIDTLFLPHLRYACLNWVRHVHGSNNTIDLADTITQFLRQHFLHWLEALSLLQKLGDGVEMMSLLESLYTNEACDLGALVEDGRRFMLYNRRMLEEAPLQVYSSAIASAPTNSVTRQTFSRQSPQWLRLLPRTRHEWSQDILTLEGHSMTVKTIAFSPDGQLLASGSDDATVRLWNLKTGANCGILKGHSSGVKAVAFSPDGAVVASASDDSTLKLWNVRTGAACGALEGHCHGIRAISFSPDSRLLASAAGPEPVRLWSVSTGTECDTLYGNSAEVDTVAFSPDGMILASGFRDMTIRLWNIGKGETCGIYKSHRGFVLSVAFSPDGRFLAASTGMDVCLWNIRRGAEQFYLYKNAGTFSGVAFSCEGRFLASNVGDAVRVWDMSSGRVHCVLAGHSRAVTAVAFSPKSRLVASSSRDATVRLWDVKVTRYRGAREHDRGSKCLTFSPDGGRLASPIFGNCVGLWNPKTGEVCGILSGHLSHVYSMAFSLDGRLIASASHDCTLKLWSTEGGTCLRTLRGHSHWVERVAFAPCSALLASGSHDGTVRLWDVGTGAVRGVLNGHSFSINSLVFSPDGHLLASLSEDSTGRIWNAETGACYAVLKGHSSSVRGVAFSPDCVYVATASSDMTVRVWNAKEGRICGTMSGHSRGVCAVAFSHDGLLVASSSLDCTVRLWGAASMDLLQTYAVHRPLHRLLFSKDANYVHTDIGAIPFDCALRGVSLPHPSSSSYFAFHDPWLFCNGKKLFWLPHEYRPRDIAIHENTIAMALGYERVIFLVVDTKNGNRCVPPQTT